MSIKPYLEQTIKNLEAEKEREVSALRQKVTNEKIVPYNREMDEARDKAIAELQTNLNATIVAYQEKFAKEKQSIIEANEKKKAEHANSVITTETYTATLKYEKVISKLNEQIEGLKE